MNLIPPSTVISINGLPLTLALLILARIVVEQVYRAISYSGLILAVTTEKSAVTGAGSVLVAINFLTVVVIDSCVREDTLGTKPIHILTLRQAIEDARHALGLDDCY